MTELIPTAKMETTSRHPVAGYLVMNFRRSVIIVELWRPEVAQTLEKNRLLRFFLKNDHLLEHFHNSVPKGVIATPIDDVLCSHFVKFGRREIGKVVRYLPDKNTLAAERIAPKIYQAQPQTMHSEHSRFYPNRSTFGGFISERVNTVGVRSKVNPIFD